MQEKEIYNIVLKYYLPENIKNCKVLGKRIIVEIIGINEDKTKDSNLKTHLSHLFPQSAVSVIHIENIAAGSSNQANPKWQIPNVKKIIGIASGKGGVGKSTTAVNIALALACQNKKIALIDADVYGPSIPTMLGYENSPMLSPDGEHFQPFMECGIQSVSVGSLINRDTPLIWRGAKACGAIEQLMTQTLWDDVDILIVDMPPGTGDILITLSQKVDFSGIIIVSTPQDIALIDAVKGVNLFKKTATPILGIIENMSYFICPHCGKPSDIFGHEGAKQTAVRLGENFLGAIPLHIDIRSAADNGTPIISSAPDSPYSKAYIEIAEKIIQYLKK